jgi:hypothetical protein
VKEAGEGTRLEWACAVAAVMAAADALPDIEALAQDLEHADAAWAWSYFLPDEEVGGRLCLPAEEFLNQAMDCGFRVVATGGLRGDRLLYHTDAEVAFHGSRQPL